METSIIDSIVLARYPRYVEPKLLEYFRKNSYNESSVEPLLTRIEYFITNPITFSEYSLTENIVYNRKILLTEIERQLMKIRKRYDSPKELEIEIEKLFIHKNSLIKYCTGQWLLPNSGVALEISEVNDSLEKPFLEWLFENFNVGVGEKVVQRHVISNNERARLKEYGLKTPFKHWDIYYYVDAMKEVQTLHKLNPQLSGIISDGSWVYNPKLYDIADDGKPYVAFTFLANEDLSGYRYFFCTANLENNQANQYKFAIRNKRRRGYITSSAIKVDVYGVFYPREELLEKDFSSLIV